MNFVLVAVLILGFGVLISLLISVISPWLIFWTAKRYSPEFQASARRHLRPSLFVLLLLFFYVVDFSFADHAANVVAVTATIACSVFLALFAFKLKPPLLGVTAGRLSIFGLLVSTPFLLIGLMFEDNSANIIESSNSMYCRQSTYGFVTTDTGTTMEVFKRYWFVDRLLVNQKTSFVYPETDKPNKSFEQDILITDLTQQPETSEAGQKRCVWH